MPRQKKEESPVSSEVEAPKKRTYTRRPKKEAVVQEKEQTPTAHEVVFPVISVVIPAYNEAERLPGTLVDAHAYFSERNEPFEIIVVDDGSVDRTSEIVERMALDLPQLRLIRQESNKGKGAAVAAGMLAARGTKRLFADADGATPFSEYDKLERKLSEGAAIAFGSRALSESVLEPAQTMIRVILGRTSNILIQITNLPGIWDTQCGFKLFTAEAADKIFPHLTAPRWGFDIEILVLARRYGLKAVEVGVRWQDKAGSTVGPNAYLQTLGENLRIRYNAITGVYPTY